jgi:circadian clock protein KaiB
LDAYELRCRRAAKWKHFCSRLASMDKVSEQHLGILDLYSREPSLDAPHESEVAAAVAQGGSARPRGRLPGDRSALELAADPRHVREGSGRELGSGRAPEDRGGAAMIPAFGADRSHASRSVEPWDLVLHVAGGRPRSNAAFANLERLCAEHLAGRFRIEVVDLQQPPQLAATDRIVALPTLVRRLPEPPCTIVGDLSGTERVLDGLRLPSRPT